MVFGWHKDSASRTQCQIKKAFFCLSIVEAPPILPEDGSPQGKLLLFHNITSFFDEFFFIYPLSQKKTLHLHQY